MNPALPRLARTYLNHHLDSRRWRLYEPCDGDVVVSTAYKAGTTWTQAIVLALLDPAREEVPNVSLQSPWPDRRFGQSDEKTAELLAARAPGRPLCLKTHLPLDAIPYHRAVRYVVVGRDARDVFMSLYNHYSNYNERMFARLNDAGRVGEPMPPCPDDPRALFRAWISRGWFEWEEEGWPFWANMGHTKSWWAFRHLTNLLFVHYGEMFEDPHTHVARIARFIGADDGEETVARVVERTGFENMKRNADKVQARMNETWHGGAKAFFHKGGSGNWQGVLGEEELALYERTRDKVLDPACAHWLEEGGEVPAGEAATRDGTR